jgi:hypothetical protein
MRRCKVCGKNEAEWIMQYMDTFDNGGNAYMPTFSLPGHHYRGFRTIPVCDPCKLKIQNTTDQIVLKDISDSFGIIKPAMDKEN